MTKKIRTAFIAISLAIFLVIPAGAVADEGHACYRQKNNDASNNEHAGVVVSMSGNQPNQVVHHPGSTVFPYQLEQISMDEFQIEGRRYYGTYYEPDSTVNDDIADMALELLNYADDIDYVLVQQMEANPAGAAKIAPRHITAFRCDGVVEYCYEYNGVPILGRYVDLVYCWDISNPAHYPYHNVVGFTPYAQMLALTPSGS